MATQPNFPGDPKVGLVFFQNADGTTAKTLFTASPTKGSKVVAIIGNSTDGTARDFRLSIVRSAVSHPLFTGQVPINAGNTNAIAPCAFLQLAVTGGTVSTPTGVLPIDQDGQVYILLQAGDALTLTPLVAVTAAAQVTFTAFAGDF